MKKLFLVLSIVGISAFGQGPAFTPPVSDVRGVGVPPSNTCNIPSQYGNKWFDSTTASDVYVCGNTGWVKQGSGAGTVITVTGTANEAVITNPTTTPNVHVIGFDGVAVTGTPTSGQVPTATSGTAATWQSPGGSLTPAGSTGDWQTNGGGGMLGAFTAGAGVQTFVVTPSSANLLAALTTSTGTGLNVFGTSPTLITPILGIPQSVTLTNGTGLPISGITGLGTGVGAALAANVSGSGAICLASGSACAPNTGTVTSVGFAGGLISVATPTSTPALTVAGTSGGIPYFSGASTWASSAAGVTGAMMAWGGAGATPTSPLSLLVTNQNSATETWTIYNSTPTTGLTHEVIKAGAAQSTASEMILATDNNNNSGFQLGTTGNGMTVTATTAYFGAGDSKVGNFAFQIINSGMRIANAYLGFGATSASAWNANVSSPDIAFTRNAAGILNLGAGTSGTTGALELQNAATIPVATLSLKTCTASTGVPWRASVNDATAPALGVALTGGGGAFANVHCSLTTGTYIVDGI